MRSAFPPLRERKNEKENEKDGATKKWRDLIVLGPNGVSVGNEAGTIDR